MNLYDSFAAELRNAMDFSQLAAIMGDIENAYDLGWISDREWELLRTVFYIASATINKGGR